MKASIKKCIKWLLVTTVIVISLGMIITGFILQASPLVTEQVHINTDTANASKQAVRRLVRSLKNQRQATNIVFTQQELNALTALAHKAKPSLSSRMILANDKAVGEFTLPIKTSLFTFYVNASLPIVSAEHALVLDNVSFGNVTLPGDWFLNIVVFLIDNFVQDKLGSDVINIVKKVTVDPAKIAVVVYIPPNFSKMNDDGKSRLIAIRDELNIFGDVKKINQYYRNLVNYMATQSLHQSFSHFVKYVIENAKKQSAQLNTSPVDENRAALTALALYFCDNRLNMLVGNIMELSFEQNVKRIQLQSSTTLLKRVDLQKHFIYSIALQLIGNHEASNLLGELKELLDAKKGGSGFSFADLLADRAGAKFAEIATFSHLSASALQGEVITLTNEQSLISSLDNLPEGIGESAFDEQYQHIESKQYQHMLSLINHRLSALPIYAIAMHKKAH